MDNFKSDLYKNATEEIEVPTSWGNMRVQIFGKRTPEAKAIVALHGYLDNSNSFKPLSHFISDFGYYIVAIDAPGHGFSSHIPPGLHYVPKITLTTLRRIIRYIELKKIIILGHSFGCINSMMYSACYPDEVEAIILIDPILGPEREKPLNEISKVWGRSIDDFLNFEMSKPKNDQQEKEKKELTFEIALDRLMKANKHLDETAARILLERALIKKDGKLEFTRDIRLKVLGPTEPYYYLDFILMSKTFHESFKCPLLYIYASPAPYGELYFNATLEFFTTLKNNKQNGGLEIIKFEGTHHFHMLEPEKTASIIKKFLNLS